MIEMGLREEVNELRVRKEVFNPAANAGWERDVAFTSPFNVAGSLTGTGSTADETIVAGSAVSTGQEHLITNIVLSASSADTLAIVSGSSTIGVFALGANAPLIVSGSKDNVLGKVDAGDALTILVVDGAGTNVAYAASVSGMVKPIHSSLETL